MGHPPTADQLGKLLREEWGWLTLTLSGSGHSAALQGRPITVLPQAVGALAQPGGGAFLFKSFLFRPFGNRFLVASVQLPVYSVYSMHFVYSVYSMHTVYSMQTVYSVYSDKEHLSRDQYSFLTKPQFSRTHETYELKVLTYIRTEKAGY